MYPNITLKIENHIPKIVYNTEEGHSKELNLENESLETLITHIAADLDIETKKDTDRYLELIRLATEGDERFIEKVPLVDKEGELGLEAAIMPELRTAMNNRDTFESYENLSEDVLKELQRNQNIDIFASILEMIYNILITKTLNHASDLGIGTIFLDDKNHNARLREKMASELSKIDIELRFV